MATNKLPLGERLNNPGNLMYDKNIPWKGMTGKDEKSGLCIFDTAYNGVRACAMDVHHKWAKDNLRTISAIIEVYCPRKDPRNDTDAYIKNVCDQMMKGPDDVLDLDSFTQLQLMVSAIVVQEQGKNYHVMDITKAVKEVLGC